MVATDGGDGVAATPPIWQSLVAGSAGGFCNTVVGHPLDTVKVLIHSITGAPAERGALLVGPDSPPSPSWFWI